MLGAIAGDIIGSIYEFDNIKTTVFPLFSRDSQPTDDTILTVALADSILSGKLYVDNLKAYFSHYPRAGYGPSFFQWALSASRQPYYSWGNGAAMRVSPVGFAYDTLEEVLEQARQSAAVTHDHPEGIKGAQATAAAIFLARQGEGKRRIRDFVEQTFGYALGEPLEDLRRRYTFDVSCQGTLPAALIAFLASEGYEDAVRKAVSLGGDSDTIACITGGIAQAFYGEVPAPIRHEALERLDSRLRRVTQDFCARFTCG
jgi:ADP-ribosylglycohydrolase